MISRKLKRIRLLTKGEMKQLAKDARQSIGSWVRMDSIHAENIVEEQVVITIARALRDAEAKASLPGKAEGTNGG